MDMSKLSQPENSVKKQFDLSGKNILITGGAGFLGRFFCEAVSEMGGFPIILDIDREALKEARKHLSNQNFKSDGYLLDLTDASAVQRTVDTIIEKYKTIDVLINAAAFAMKNLKQGGPEFFASFEEYKKDLWQISLDVNLTGTFLITQAVGRIMKLKKKGVIINVASDVAVVSPDHRIYQPDERFDYKGVSFNTPLSYAVAKAGILSFTRYLATYWAKDGIRVNSVSFSGVYRNHDPKFVEQLSFRIPLGRMAFPQEYKGPIVFLASEASSFMTGANLVIDGGRTCW
ncbi:MAG: SDR family oxidoreductase [Candidatus Omnitrophica bacterium]|nr:SDR family oxidoreductase [Candidatus Omnitrophota bacterium]